MRTEKIVLVNLGTPEDCTVPAVRNFLREFLMDPLVIDIPTTFRWLLVEGIILRVRPKKSAALYQKIWTKRGSPLSTYLFDLKDKLSQMGIECEVAMRYGQPSIQSVFQKLKQEGVSHVKCIPLYPQYAEATTGSTVLQLAHVAKEVDLKATFIPEFYQDSRFIELWVNRIEAFLKEHPVDHLLFSYHGLPNRQLKKANPTHCLASEECCVNAACTVKCYRSQCLRTSELISLELKKRLGASTSFFSSSFQSRLGRGKWIQPYTEEVLPALARQGVEKVAVACPSFVSDCLETLEEISIRAKERFLQAGGQDLLMIPSLNAQSDWAQVLVEIARKPSIPVFSSNKH